MNIIGIAALFGAGYVYNDYRKSVKQYTPSYYLNSNGHPASIKQYLKNVAMDKMDDIFYGRKRKHSKKPFAERKINYKAHYGSISCPVIPFNSFEYADEVLEKMKRDIQRYGKVRVRDFLFYSDMLYGCDEVSYDDANEYGWYILDDVDIYQDEDDDYYYINLPDPVYIY